MLVSAQQRGYHLLYQPGPAACPVPPPSLSALQLHTGAFHQPEDQTPTRSQPRWRVLTRAAFIRALAQAQTKQDAGSEAAGRMGPVWAEATGVKSVFSSLSSTSGPRMASPSLRLWQPRVRAQRESKRHPLFCCVWLFTVQCPPWGQEAFGAITRKPRVTTLQPSGQCKHNSTACLGNRSIAAHL